MAVLIICTVQVLGELGDYKALCDVLLFKYSNLD